MTLNNHRGLQGALRSLEAFDVEVSDIKSGLRKNKEGNSWLLAAWLLSLLLWGGWLVDAMLTKQKQKGVPSSLHSSSNPVYHKGLCCEESQLSWET